MEQLLQFMNVLIEVVDSLDSVSPSLSSAAYRSMDTPHANLVLSTDYATH